MSDLIYRDDAIKAIQKDSMGGLNYEGILNRLPSVEPDNKLAKIINLVEGTIDHFDLDDAMDLLYQIKEILR